MSIQIFGSAATVSYLNRAFTDISPSDAIFINQVANAESMGDMVFANTFAASWAGVNDTALSKQVLTNMGILSATSSPPALLLQQSLTDYFAAYGVKTIGSNGQITADTRGFIVLQLARILSSLETSTGDFALYNTAAIAWNNEIAAAYTYSSNPNNTSPSNPNTPTASQTYTLTMGTDTFTGTAGDDLFNAPLASTAAGNGDTLTVFDSISGGDGNDTLNAVITTPTATGVAGGVSVTGVENITLNVTGSAGVPFTVGSSAFTGATHFTINNASGGITVEGGSSGTVVNVNSGNAATAQTVNVKGSALTAVSAKGGLVTIDNTDAAGTSGFGTTLTAVTIESIRDNAAVEGRAISNLTWKNQYTAYNVTVTDDTTTDVTVNVDGVGYDTSGNTVVDWLILGIAATTLTINATGSSSSLAVDGSAAINLKTVNVTGSAAFNLSSGALPITVTKVDASSATGIITLDTTGLTATTSISTGTGADTVTLLANITSGIINLGAGDDTLTGTATLTTPRTLDGGDGNDTFAITLLNGVSTSDLAALKNFEVMDIGGGGNVDISQLTGSTIKGLTLSTPMSSSVISNIPAGVGLTVTGQVAATTTSYTNELKLANTAGSADTFSVVFTGGDPSLISDGSNLLLNGIENIRIDSSGASIQNKVMLTTDSLQTLTITGDQNLTLTLATTADTPSISSSDTVRGVRLLDGSAATGKLTIDASTIDTSTIANAGLTIQGGTGADNLKGSIKADTIIGGDGADVITGGGGGDNITLSGNTSTISIVAGDDTGGNNATATQTALLTSNFDIITGVVAGTKLSLGAAGSPPSTGGNGAFATVLNTSATASSNLATSLQGAENAVVLARGTYDAANGIFNYGASGADTALTYDWNNSAVSNFHTIILVGYAPSTTAASFALGTATTAATLTLA